MRICQFSSASLDSHYFANLCRGLSEKGISVALASLQQRQHPGWLLELADARYFFLDAGSWLSYPQAVLRLARVLRRERIDILQTHLFHAGLIGVLAAKLASVPVCIVTRHHTDEAGMVGTKLHVGLDRLMARMADGVVVLSQAVKKHMISSERLVEDKIEVIYQGFDFNKLSASEEDRQRVRSEFGFGSDFVIGYVARFFKTKAHSHLIAACSELVKEIPNMRLLLLGGGDRSSITEMIPPHLKDRVVFAGYRMDVPACIRAMDVVVHPSLTEAFCQAHVETMAVGTPLIATNVAAAPEVITPGKTGILIPPADPGAIVTAVLQLYQNPELGRRMAIAGQESVRRRFTIERMVDQQANCYERLLKRSLGSEKIHVGSQI
jgi:glycosyltransferase involved in cell wall biosynthesis